MFKFILFIFTKKFWLSIAVFLILSVIGTWLLFVYLGSRTQHGQEMKVPLLIGYHVSEVENLLTQDRLNYVIMDSIYVEKADGGMVVEQNPDSGFYVKSGRKIYLTISSYNAPKIPVPNLKWDQKRNVIAQLTSMGFKIGTIRYIPSVCEDCLERVEIDSIEIKPGSRLDLGTKLNLVLGGGESDRFVGVPNLMSIPLFSVESVIKNSGLILGSIILDEDLNFDDSAKAFVYKQIPKTGGDNVYLGSAINVFITANSNKLPNNELDSTSQPEENVEFE